MIGIHSKTVDFCSRRPPLAIFAASVPFYHVQYKKCGSVRLQTTNDQTTPDCGGVKSTTHVTPNVVQLVAVGRRNQIIEQEQEQ